MRVMNSPIHSKAINECLDRHAANVALLAAALESAGKSAFEINETVQALMASAAAEL